MEEHLPDSDPVPAPPRLAAVARPPSSTVSASAGPPAALRRDRRAFLGGPFGCVVVALAIAVLGLGGWYGYLRLIVGPQDVEIAWATLPPDGVLTVDLDVKRFPDSGHPESDLYLRLTSKVLQDELRMPWSEIVEYIDKTLPEGAPPPLGKVRMRRGIEALLKGSLNATASDFYITVEVFWGGKRQDKTLVSVQHWYHR